MTRIKSGNLPLFFSSAGFEPVGGGLGDGVFGQHAGQAGENVGEVLLGVDAEAVAVFDDGVEDPPYPANAERANIPTIPRSHPKVWAFCNW